MGDIIVNAAMRFALDSHGDQDHGCLKISEHLEDVVKHVDIHYDKTERKSWMTRSETLCAAWMHDVFEDTAATSTQMYDALSVPSDYVNIDAIVGAVFDLTDKPGRNRKERHLKTYWKVRLDACTTLIKLCDRRHNQHRSLVNCEKYLIMYAKEYDYFKFALWYPDEYPELWEELDEQNRKMREHLGW